MMVLRGMLSWFCRLPIGSRLLLVLMYLLIPLFAFLYGGYTSSENGWYMNSTLDDVKEEFQEMWGSSATPEPVGVKPGTEQSEPPEQLDGEKLEKVYVSYAEAELQEEGRLRRQEIQVSVTGVVISEPNRDALRTVTYQAANTGPVALTGDEIELYSGIIARSRFDVWDKSNVAGVTVEWYEPAGSSGGDARLTHSFVYTSRDGQLMRVIKP